MGRLQGKLNAYQIAKAEAVRKHAAALGAQPIPLRDAGRVLDERGKVVAVAVARTVYEIVDVSQVPRELMRVDPSAINARITQLKQQGMPLEIPGLRITEVLRTSTR
jgi:hypothetical protein